MIGGGTEYGSPTFGFQYRLAASITLGLGKPMSPITGVYVNVLAGLILWLVIWSKPEFPMRKIRVEKPEFVKDPIHKLPRLKGPDPGSPFAGD